LGRCVFLCRPGNRTLAALAGIPYLDLVPDAAQTRAAIIALNKVGGQRFATVAAKVADGALTITGVRQLVDMSMV
jgi:hypothetical protein